MENTVSSFQNCLRYPDGNVLLRNLNRNYPLIAHGKGVYLSDTSGKRYLDGSGGALVVSVGHGNQEVVQQIQRQLEQVAYVNGMQFTSPVAEDLARELNILALDLSLAYGDPYREWRSSFLCSGSEAVEAAIKFVRQLWVERGELERSKIIARSPGYHGNTLFALSASARPHYKKFFEPLLHDVIMVPAPYEYRSAVPDYWKSGGEYYASLLEQTIIREEPHTIAGFIFEPVIGSSAGGSLPPPGYFDQVQEICQKYRVPMIADEIMCGSGRTGTFFASQHYGLDPDIILLGKGINGGYLPLSVMMVKNIYVNEIKGGSGNFLHAQTYLQAPCMAAAGMAILDFFEQNNVLDHCQKQGEIFHKLLLDRILPLPHVGHITGKGLLAGVELVKDKSKKTCFERSEKIAERLFQEAFQNGLIFWTNVGQSLNEAGDLIILGPPLTISTSEIEELVFILEKTLNEFSW